MRDKLTVRHPHVFGDVQVSSSDEVAVNWEAIKQKEKGRTSALDGIAWQLPSLALYQKVAKKAQRLGVDEAALEQRLATSGDDGVVGELIELVRRGTAEGIDLEGALRGYVLSMRDAIRAIEETSEKS